MPLHSHTQWLCRNTFQALHPNQISIPATPRETRKDETNHFTLMNFFKHNSSKSTAFKNTEIHTPLSVTIVFDANVCIHARVPRPQLCSHMYHGRHTCSHLYCSIHICTSCNHVTTSHISTSMIYPAHMYWSATGPSTYVYVLRHFSCV